MLQSHTTSERITDAQRSAEPKLKDSVSSAADNIIMARPRYVNIAGTQGGPKK